MTFDEIVYPAMLANFDNNPINLICQKDNIPGLNPTPNQIYNESSITLFEVEIFPVYVSNEDIDKNLISVYPVPASDVLYITGVSNFTHLKLVDILGQLVLEQEFHISNGALNIDVSSFQEGIYFIQLESQDYKNVKKIVIGK